VIFGRLGKNHHELFGSWSFDMAIYDQAFWKVSRFQETFMTVRGLEFWGHHVNLIAYLYAPFYWLGAGPTFLYVSQAVVLGFGAVPVYLLARDRLSSPWIGFGFALAYCWYAPIQFITWANFHPEALVVTPTLFAWWCARAKRWRAFTVFALIALSTREDAAMVFILMGLLLIWHGWTDRKPGVRLGVFASGPDRTARVGAIVAVGSVCWYLICTQIILPNYNNNQAPFYVARFFGEFGDNMFEVLGSMIRNPNRVVSLAIEKDRLVFYLKLLGPLAATPLLGLAHLTMAGPQMLSSITSTQPYSRLIDYQYTSMIIAPIFIGAIEGISRRVAKKPNRRTVLLVILCASYISNVAWSPSPIGNSSWYWMTTNSRAPQMRAALALIPPDAGVASTYDFGPHVSQRDLTYDWPNPFIPTIWGNDDPANLWPAAPNPNNATWVIFDREKLFDAANPDPILTELVDRLIGPNGEFEVVYDQKEIVVAKRVRPDSPPDVGPVPISDPALLEEVDELIGDVSGDVSGDAIEPALSSPIAVLNSVAPRPEK
jgi:uncharacterized membrane protein